MRKRNPFPLFAETAVPLVPVFPELVEKSSALTAAAWTSLVYLVSAILFKFLSPALPKRLQPLTYLLTACAFLYAVSLFFPVAAAPAAVSVFLLNFPPEERRKKPAGAPAIFLKAAAFFGLAAGLGFAQDLLGRYLGMAVFQRIPGTFLLLFGAAVLWPRRRRYEAPKDILYPEAVL